MLTFPLTEQFTVIVSTLYDLDVSIAHLPMECVASTDGVWMDLCERLWTLGQMLSRKWQGFDSQGSLCLAKADMARNVQGVAVEETELRTFIDRLLHLLLF